MSQSDVKTPVWFWIVAALAVAWNLVGVMSYIGQVTLSAEALAAMSDAEQALFENTPAWATSAFAIAVFAGVLASLCLVLKKAWAGPLFILSLVAIIIQFTYWLFLSGATAVYGGQTYIMPGMVTAIAIFLLWFSQMAKNKGLLR